MKALVTVELQLYGDFFSFLCFFIAVELGGLIVAIRVVITFASVIIIYKVAISKLKGIE